jgi:hypothetical protein
MYYDDLKYELNIKSNNKCLFTNFIIFERDPFTNVLN